MDFPQPEMIEVNGVTLEVFSAAGHTTGAVPWMARTCIFLALFRYNPELTPVTTSSCRIGEVMELQPTRGGDRLRY